MGIFVFDLPLFDLLTSNNIFLIDISYLKNKYLIQKVYDAVYIFHIRATVRKKLNQH